MLLWLFFDLNIFIVEFVSIWFFVKNNIRKYLECFIFLFFSSSIFCWRNFPLWFFASSWMFISAFLALRRFISTVMELRSIIGDALSFLNTLWIWISFDTLFLISNIMSFHRLTSRIAASNVGDHGYWFCFFIYSTFQH